MPTASRLKSLSAATAIVSRCACTASPECSFSWRHQLPLLARLGYTAWAPNLRGYGRTTRPQHIGDYALAHLRADIAGLIDAADKRSTLLIGHDWGGAIAWSFVLEPLRPIERFIAMNIPHPALMFAGIARFPQLLRSWYIAFFQMPILPELYLTAFGAKAIGDAFLNMAVHKDQFPEHVLDVYRRQALEPGAMTAMLNYYRALFRGWPRQNRMHHFANRPLETPTLMIWGEHDTALGKELTLGTDQFVRNLTLHYIPDASHWVQQDTPETVNTLIEEWLK